MFLARQDKLSLTIIVALILLIQFVLLTPKGVVGCGPIDQLFGVHVTIGNGSCTFDNLPWVLKLVQNSVGDAGSAEFDRGYLVIKAMQEKGVLDNFICPI